MNPLLLAEMSDCLDAEEFLLLYRMSRRKRKRSFDEGFDLSGMTSEEILQNFRFELDDMEKLRHLFRIPDHLTTEFRVTSTGLEGFSLLLRRLAYPNRLFDLTKIFQRSESELSQIFNLVLDHIYSNFQYLLTDLHQPWIVNNLQIFCEAVHNKGAPLMNCWGFLDGTVRPICRPKIHQRVVYNGHKRVHSLKYQSIMAPNGLIANLAGPFEGRRHDSFILTESNILDELRNLGEFSIYGDPAYPLRNPIINPFHGLNLTPEQEEFNKSMSRVRQCVEWGFGKILSNFSFLDYKKNQKLFLQPVGKYYVVSTILTNCHTCLYGSQTSQYFGIDPPTLDEYFRV